MEEEEGREEGVKGSPDSWALACSQKRHMVEVEGEIGREQEREGRREGKPVLVVVVVEKEERGRWVGCCMVVALCRCCHRYSRPCHIKGGASNSHDEGGGGGEEQTRSSSSGTSLACQGARAVPPSLFFSLAPSLVSAPSQTPC